MRPAPPWRQAPIRSRVLGRPLRVFGTLSPPKQTCPPWPRAAAYGWPADLSDEQILERLLALNLERAAEGAKAAKAEKPNT